jgi:hypothetical protein
LAAIPDDAGLYRAWLRPSRAGFALIEEKRFRQQPLRAAIEIAPGFPKS